MCRLAAYSGPPLLLRRLLLEPPHNLVRQAYAPDDSEYLFALILQELAAQPGDPAAAIAGAIGTLDCMLNGRKALLALILCDGERLYAMRHALNATLPTLYSCEQEAGYPEALPIASERLTAALGWQAVSPQQLLIAASGRILKWRPL